MPNSKTKKLAMIRHKTLKATSAKVIRGRGRRLSAAAGA
jgi:hypothetical protein